MKHWNIQRKVFEQLQRKVGCIYALRSLSMSVRRCLKTSGCFFANSLMISGVLKACRWKSWDLRHYCPRKSCSYKGLGLDCGQYGSIPKRNHRLVFTWETVACIANCMALRESTRPRSPEQSRFREASNSPTSNLLLLESWLKMLVHVVLSQQSTFTTMHFPRHFGAVCTSASYSILRWPSRFNRFHSVPHQQFWRHLTEAGMATTACRHY